MWRVWRTIFVLRLPMIKIAPTHNNRVLTITMASPQNHNALTSESISRLRDVCHQAQAKQAIFLNSSVAGMEDVEDVADVADVAGVAGVEDVEGVEGVEGYFCFKTAND